MKPIERQKLCPNCDGRISYDTVQCPYCFVLIQSDTSTNKILNPSFSSNPLYTPSSLKSMPTDSVDQKISKPLYNPEKEPDLEKNETSNEEGGFVPILLITVGGNLLTLGVLQFLFSDHGKIYLEIEGSYWFIMILTSLPLFYFGLRNLSNK